MDRVDAALFEKVLPEPLPFELSSVRTSEYESKVTTQTVKSKPVTARATKSALRKTS
jgi:predicted secreted protein